MKWIVFNTEADAQRVLDKISEVLGYPEVGTYRGQLDPSKQQTIAWATPRQIVKAGQLNGKWTFRVLKDNIPARLREMAQTWLDNQGIQYAILDYHPSWFE